MAAVGLADQTQRLRKLAALCWSLGLSYRSIAGVLAAFDRSMVGVSPDYVIYVREDILEEEDGPMLQHGLQELNEGRLQIGRASCRERV